LTNLTLWGYGLQSPLMYLQQVKNLTFVKLQNVWHMKCNLRRHQLKVTTYSPPHTGYVTEVINSLSTKICLCDLKSVMSRQ
jgi:hypothetical protein